MRCSVVPFCQLLHGRGAWAGGWDGVSSSDNTLKGLFYEITGQKNQALTMTEVSCINALLAGGRIETSDGSPISDNPTNLNATLEGLYNSSNQDQIAGVNLLLITPFPPPTSTP